MSLKPVSKTSPRDKYSTEEWAARCELAACYRVLAKFRMTDLTNTHVSLRVPGNEEHYLLNGYGLLFEEITASNLVKFDLSGNVLDDSPYEMNPAGFAFHAGVHIARKDARAVLHTHTRAGCAIAALKRGLLPLNQMSLVFYDRIAYSDYAYVERVDEASQLVRDLGDKKAMIMRNHGLLTCGGTVGEAFMLTYYLDKACQIQLDTLASGEEIHVPPASVCAEAADRWWTWYKDAPFGQTDWDALVRQLDREDPSYKT
jgi:ribulose-5-phosphate 4-epimerase/fuculose-1-phosphate aldolase